MLDRNVSVIDSRGSEAAPRHHFRGARPQGAERAVGGDGERPLLKIQA